MPTDRPRHTITETDAIAVALDEAGRRWPDEQGSRGRLLVRLVHEGHEALRADADDEAKRRRAALRATAGTLTGTYPPGYLGELRDDWPA